MAPELPVFVWCSSGAGEALFHSDFRSIYLQFQSVVRLFQEVTEEPA